MKMYANFVVENLLVLEADIGRLVVVEYSKLVYFFKGFIDVK